MPSLYVCLYGRQAFQGNTAKIKLLMLSPNCSKPCYSSCSGQKKKKIVSSLIPLSPIDDKNNSVCPTLKILQNSITFYHPHCDLSHHHLLFPLCYSQHSSQNDFLKYEIMSYFSSKSSIGFSSKTLIFNVDRFMNLPALAQGPCQSSLYRSSFSKCAFSSLQHFSIW